jgi:hypothetical protein
MSDDVALREKIRGLLSDGLRTQVEPVPKDNVDFDAILRELHDLDESQLEEKLMLSGFVDKPHGHDQQRCHDCMYYAVHRKWCVLPQLGLPVEPDWWCRLWRV